jgi:hypothetical protein
MVTTQSDLVYRKKNRPVSTWAGLAAAAFCAALLLVMAMAGSASAKVRTFHPVKVHRGVATFKLNRLAPATISSAHLGGLRNRAFSRHQMRAAVRRGVMHVRISKRSKSNWGPRKRNQLKLVAVSVAPKSHESASKRKNGSHGGSTTTTTTSGTTTTGDTTTTSGTTTSGTTTTGGTTTTSGTTTTTTTTTTTAPTGPSGPTGPTIDTGTCSSISYLGFGSFGEGNWPGGCWRPYADSSPFNQVLPGSPRLASNSAQIVQRMMSDSTYNNGKPSDMEASADWGHPLFYAKSTDPLFTVHCTKSWGTCEPEGRTIRIPDAARPAPAGDGHMAVIQPNGDEYDFWQVTRKDAGGGRLEASWGGITSVSGDGLNSDATAAHFGLAAGIIRAQELEAGHINHALFMVVKCDNGQIAWPANGHGQPCTAIGASNTDAPAEGQRFQLDPGYNVDALSIPTWKKTILKAMQRYGLYVGDTGGGGWGLSAESGMTYQSFGDQDELMAYGKTVGVPYYSPTNKYVFNLKDGVDWSRLRVVDPCVSQGTC